MDDTAMKPADDPLPSGVITSWRDFQDRVRAAMAMAVGHPADMSLMDTDFGHWPLGERSVMEAFHQWALASRGTQGRLLAAHYDLFPRVHPRWVAWRGTWSHRIDCRQVSEDMVPSLVPMMVLHGIIGLRLLEPSKGTGVWTRNPRSLREWLSEFDVISQRSEPALPPTTVGL